MLFNFNATRENAIGSDNRCIFIIGYVSYFVCYLGLSTTTALGIAY